MACAYLCTDSCFSLWYNRIRECNNIYPFFHHTFCKFCCCLFIIKHNRYTWMCSRDDIETVIYQFLSIICSHFFQVITKFCAFLQHIKQLKARSRDCRCQGIREQVRTASLSQKIDDFLTSGCISAGCSSECFS